MKSIVIMFDANIKHEQELVKSLAETMIKSGLVTNDERDIHVNVHVLNDETVMRALVATTVPNCTPRQKVSTIEELCKTIIKVVGSPSLKPAEVFRKHLLKAVQDSSELRSCEGWKKINNLSKEDCSTLQYYGLENLISWRTDIQTIFRVFGYGKI